QYCGRPQKASRFKGGASRRGFINLILDDAVASLSDAEKTELLKSALRNAMTISAASPPPAKPRPFVKKWNIDELTRIVETGLAKRDFDRGRKLFGEASASPAIALTTKADRPAPT